MPKRKQKIEPWQIRDKRKRSKHTLPPRKRYLICTEGKSEAIYFDHYKSSTGPDVIALDKSDHKISLVKKAMQERELRIKTGEFDKEIDEVWVVLDRDINLANKSDKSNFNDALNLAKKNDVFIAYSNDAFELWLILHYKDLQTSTHRDELFKSLSKIRGKKYDKTEDIYKEIKQYRPQAMQRAANLLKVNHHPESGNPSTTVHKLVAKLLNEPGFREEY